LFYCSYGTENGVIKEWVSSQDQLTNFPVPLMQTQWVYCATTISELLNSMTWELAELAQSSNVAGFVAVKASDFSSSQH
jgi:hypothetical protein